MPLRKALSSSVKPLDRARSAFGVIPSDDDRALAVGTVIVIFHSPGAPICERTHRVLLRSLEVERFIATLGGLFYDARLEWEVVTHLDTAQEIDQHCRRRDELRCLTGR